jgi:hypothetical protein
MSDACADCERGPVGIAGHDSLFSYSMGASEMYFKCRACGSSWLRRPRDSSYSWQSVERPVGADVPGRPGTTAP